MLYHIDLFSAFLGTITIVGWAEGGVPMPWSSSSTISEPIEPLIAHAIERPDLVERYGPESLCWGFKLVFYVGDYHDPRELFLYARDGKYSRICDLFDYRSNEEVRFWSMADRFKDAIRSKRSARILEIGLPPLGRDIFSDCGSDIEYVGASDAAGPDVDVIVDFDELSAVLTAPFDFAYCVSLFDKAWMPWKLAVELGKVLKPGAIAYVQSAGAWPMASDERDFWRFSKHAWGALFTREAGFAVMQVEQAGRVRLVLEQASTLHRGLEKHHHYTLSGCLVQRLEEA